jgi:hypothetical protein
VPEIGANRARRAETSVRRRSCDVHRKVFRFSIPRRAVVEWTVGALAEPRPLSRGRSVAVVPFLRNELAVPAQDRIRRDDSGDLPEHLAPEDLPFDSQASALVVVEPDALLAVRFSQDLILGTDTRWPLAAVG